MLVSILKLEVGEVEHYIAWFGDSKNNHRIDISIDDKDVLMYYCTNLFESWSYSSR